MTTGSYNKYLRKAERGFNTIVNKARHIPAKYYVPLLCDAREKVDEGTWWSYRDDCVKVAAAFNTNMSQIFEDNKESIDHILYG